MESDFESRVAAAAVARTASQGVPVAQVPAAAAAPDSSDSSINSLEDLNNALSAETDPLKRSKIYNKHSAKFL